MKLITEAQIKELTPVAKKGKWQALNEQLIALKGSQYLFISKGEFQKNGYSPKFQISAFCIARKKLNLDYQRFEEGYVLTKKS